MSIETFFNRQNENEGKSRDICIQVGGGDPIKITSLTKIISEGVGSPDYKVRQEPLPKSSLLEVGNKLENLPFRIGDKEHIGTMPREAHNAHITISPRELPQDAPKAIRNQKMLSFRFDEKIAHYPISLDTHNNLTIQQRTIGEPNPLGKSEYLATVVKFIPESSFPLASAEIGEICLVIPSTTP